ncbi:hypothetical protein HSIVP1_1718 [Veillonella parvula HSIVP1]|jgi:hypothetical protein|nr:hypothetical protein [Veillonella parvula]EQC64759.1 hypothetical protein HSIVP1_1718 [Veillonella parvula HSIVP1]
MRKDLLNVVETFEEDYKETLHKYNSKVSEDYWNLLYDLGADIKKALKDLSEKLD